ncbi:MAG: Asp-tRNA(Asn)/Glu-tRNA(Gln) amidotransferase subunit GatC [Candidatus Harrisonbacteria bacterium]|nr:Asp-tRNA(Asn)/Glu-tRNA(Gln) amidotransferase subunit GatC [Candidatus Harrisonbacteria bacterium]
MAKKQEIIINKSAIKKLASLTRITLKEKEAEVLERDLEAILGYFNELNELNTDGIKIKVSGVEAENVFREDMPAISPSESRADSAAVRDAFPRAEKGYIKVPKVFE